MSSESINTRALANRRVAIEYSQNLALFLLSAAIQVVFLILFAYKGLWFILAVLVITGLFFYTLFSVPRMFYFFTAYITISVEYLYLSYFPGFPVYYSLKIAIPLFILLLVYWLTYLLKTEERADLRILDYFIISHLVLSIISAARGYFYGYKLSYCVWDFMAQFWYLGYFIFQYSPLKNHIERLYDMLLVFTLLLSFEYIYGYTKLASLGGLFLTRIVGKNIHLAQFAIPYIGGIFIFGAPRWRKFLAGLSLPFILVAVFFSQQRSLWFSITITLIILLIIFLYVRRRWLIKNVKKILLVSLLLVLVFIVLNVILDLYFKQKLFLTAFARFLIFLNPELFTYDLSWRIRWREIGLVFEDLNGHLFFGRGFGASIVSMDRHFILLAPDHAYIYILWKMGIIGLIIWSMIQLLFIKRCLFILKKGTIAEEKIFALTALLNLFGLMVIGLSNCALTTYEYIFIWSAIIATIEIISRKYAS